MKSPMPETDTNRMIENLLPMVRKIADAKARRFDCPLLGFDDLYQIGSEALMKAAERFRPAESYNDEGQAEAHFWKFPKRRVIGAMIDEFRKENRLQHVAPEKIVPLSELDSEPADRRNDHAEDPAAGVIEIVKNIYNRYGAKTAEFVIDYALNGVPQKVLASRYGVCQASISHYWTNISQRIRTHWE